MNHTKSDLVLVFVGASIVSLLAIALGFVEFRTLISGEAMLYENAASQFAQLFFRFLGMALLLTNAVIAIIGLWKSGAFTTLVLCSNFGALVFSIAALFFYEWYFAVALIFANFLLLAAPLKTLLRTRIFKKTED